MKNLANCKPSEFLVQTNKIRKSVEKWLTVTDIMNIRRTQPELAEGMSREERQAAQLALRERIDLHCRVMRGVELAQNQREH